jgi:hypothetical protein
MDDGIHFISSTVLRMWLRSFIFPSFAAPWCWHTKEITTGRQPQRTRFSRQKPKLNDINKSEEAKQLWNIGWNAEYRILGITEEPTLLRIKCKSIGQDKRIGNCRVENTTSAYIPSGPNSRTSTTVTVAASSVCLTADLSSNKIN